MHKTINLKSVLIMVLTVLLSAGRQKTDWKMMQAPLMTRWAKDVSPQNALPEYPRPQMVRAEWKNLNGLWQFAKAEEKDPIPFNQNLERLILAPYPIESALSGIMEKTKYAFYRKEIDIPQNWSGKEILLHFGAVDFEAIVFVNGKKVGGHRGGYDPFSFNITSYLKVGQKQEIIVKVFDPTDEGFYARGKQVDNPEGIFYTSVTGIWQTVWMEAVESAHISALRILPDIDKHQVNIRAIGSGSAAGKKITVEAEGLEKVDGICGENIVLPVKNMKLWSPENPKLYDMKITLSNGDAILDEVKSYFAMRKISLGKDKDGVTRIMFNNEFVFQNGTLDQGYWPDGLYTAPTDDALKYDIEIAKKLGFNMIRKHAKVEPARWYFWTDKLGMIVWQDMPPVFPAEFEKRSTTETKKQFETELSELVNDFYNYPSIVMWIVFNEAWGQYDTERLTNWVKERDPNRLVSNASGWDDKKVGDIIDMHKYPGPGAPEPEENRAAVLGEFGGLGLPVESHLWTFKNWGYEKMADKQAFRNNYEKLYDEVWSLKDKLSAVVYTQISDVETETNGHLTYDREVLKMDVIDTYNFHTDNLVSVPKIDPPGAMFLENALVMLSNRKGEDLHYTLNGSEPTVNSPRYQKPLTITDNLTLKVKSFNKEGRCSGTVSADFIKTTLVDAPEISAQPEPGIAFKYFYGTRWDSVPDFNKLIPKSEGITQKMDLSVAKEVDMIGLVFEGFIKIDKEGVYSFYTDSDDGSYLYINDKQLINNDGCHAMREKRGQIALKKAYHKIRVTFFEDLGGEGLVVRYAGPGIEKQEIPGNVLYH